MTISHPLPAAPFIEPHPERNFASLPQFIKSRLVAGESSPFQPAGIDRWPQQYKTVILIFLDALGWCRVEQFQDHPAIQRFLNSGSVNKLTSQFPSTTTAHITTLYTGLPVGRHGLYEWHLYAPQLDRIIMPIMWSYSGDEERDTLENSGLDIQDMLPAGPTFTQSLADHGVAPTILQPHAYAHSTYSTAVTASAQMIGYQTLPEALATLGQRLDEQHSPAFYALYFGLIDYTCHHYDPNSPQAAAEVEAALSALDYWLRQQPDRAGDALLLVSADHGQVTTPPGRTIYLNRLPQFEQLRPLLRTNRAGQILAPAGSCRDMFLYIRDGHVDEARALLNGWLQGRAEVHKTGDLAAAGYFGPPPTSAAFQARVGDLVILPYEKESVWWFEAGRFEQKYLGNHGGLLPGEMEIPLLLHRL